MAFWNRKPSADGSDYYPNAKKRLNKVLDLMDELDRLSQNPFATLRLVENYRIKIQAIIDETQALALPADAYQVMATHKQNTLKLMDFQMRKLLDVLHNRGEGLEAIAAEEQAFGASIQRDEQKAEDDSVAFTNELGLPPFR